MHDAVFVRVTQTARHLQHDLGGTQRRDATVTYHHVERVPVEQLHHQEWHAVVGAQIEDLHDVFVVEPSRDARLTLELKNQLLERHVAGLQHEFDGHRAIEQPVDGPEDVPHAAFAELVDDLEAPVGPDAVAPTGRAPKPRNSSAGFESLVARDHTLGRR